MGVVGRNTTNLNHHCITLGTPNSSLEGQKATQQVLFHFTSTRTESGRWSLINQTVQGPIRWKCSHCSCFNDLLGAWNPVVFLFLRFLLSLLAWSLAGWLYKRPLLVFCFQIHGLLFFHFHSLLSSFDVSYLSRSPGRFFYLHPPRAPSRSGRSPSPLDFAFHNRDQVPVLLALCCIRT